MHYKRETENSDKYDMDSFSYSATHKLTVFTEMWKSKPLHIQIHQTSFVHAQCYFSVLSRKVITLVCNRYVLSVKSCQSKLFWCWKSHFTDLFSKQLCHVPKIYLLVDLQLHTPGHVSILGAPDSKVHGANMGPVRGRQDPGGPHVDPMKIATWAYLRILEWTCWCYWNCCT